MSGPKRPEKGRNVTWGWLFPLAVSPKRVSIGTLTRFAKIREEITRALRDSGPKDRDVTGISLRLGEFKTDISALVVAIEV